MTETHPGLEQIIDHAAALQTRVDALQHELRALALAGVALSVIVAVLAWRVNHG